MKLILGSQSPRRRELLARMGLEFTVLTAEIDETKYETEDPEESVCRICREKALAVAKAFPLGGRCPSAKPPKGMACASEHSSPALPAGPHRGPGAERACTGADEGTSEDASALVLTADTIVVLDGRILGKPHDEAGARAMLRALSGREHEVYTAFTLLPVGMQNVQSETHCEKTAVKFRELTEAEIAAYVGSGEPMDKAGAYGIQGLGAMLVESIRGDYFTVMGLPVCQLYRALKRYGIDPLSMQEKKL